jgi:nicotinamidase-related amidase
MPSCLASQRRSRWRATPGSRSSTPRSSGPASTRFPLGLRQNSPRLLEEWNQSPNLGRGCWGAQISDVVAPQPGDLVLTKTGFDCPGLGQIAGPIGVERVFVIGTTANNCVYAAALALFEANLDVVAVEDCISSFNDEMKLPWLHNIARFLGSVVTFDDYQALVGRGRVR